MPGSMPHGEGAVSELPREGGELRTAISDCLRMDVRDSAPSLGDSAPQNAPMCANLLRVHCLNRAVGRASRGV